MEMIPRDRLEKLTNKMSDILKKMMNNIPGSFFRFSVILFAGLAQSTRRPVLAFRQFFSVLSLR